MPRKKKPSGPQEKRLDVFWYCLPSRPGRFIAGKTYKDTVTMAVATKAPSQSPRERLLILAALRALHTPHLDDVPDNYITITRTQESRVVNVMAVWCHRDMGMKRLSTYVTVQEPRGGVMREERFKQVVFEALQEWFLVNYTTYDVHKLRLVTWVK